MITNVRIGNDIKLIWQILKGGQPVDLTGATDVKVSVFQGGNSSCGNVYIDTFKITDAVNGILSVEIPKEVITEVGYMWTVLEYTLHDDDMIDGDRKVTVDNVPVRIVSLTAEASQVYEFNVSSDILAGFHGKSAFEVWLKDNPDKTLQDYFDWLQQPATDIEQVVSSNETVRVSSEETRQLNETARIEAETLRGSAETQRISNENTRKSNETGRINAETLRLSAEEERGTAEGLRASSETSRNTAEGQRATAETARATAEGLRQSNTATAIQQAVSATTAATTAAGEATDAAGLANDAAEAANSAAGLADTARLAIQDDLALKADQADLAQLESDVKETTEKPTAQSLSELNARITALEAILSNKIKDRVDVTKEFNVWGKTNLILYGDGASTKTPDFIGQTYIDTTNGNVYIAVGNSNAGNWKLV